MFLLESDWVKPVRSLKISLRVLRRSARRPTPRKDREMRVMRLMRKFRLFAAIFALFMVAGCADVAPTAPQDDGFLGSGDIQ